MLLLCTSFIGGARIDISYDIVGTCDCISLIPLNIPCSLQVMQTERLIYLVTEYASGGEIFGIFTLSYFKMIYVNLLLHNNKCVITQMVEVCSRSGVCAVVVCPCCFLVYSCILGNYHNSIVLYRISVLVELYPLRV